MADVVNFGPLEQQFKAQIADATEDVNELTAHLEQAVDNLTALLEKAKERLNRLQASKSALSGEPVSLLATTVSTVFPRKKRKYNQLPENRPLKIAAQHLRRAKERGAPKAEIARLEKERDDAQAALRAAKLKKKE